MRHMLVALLSLLTITACASKTTGPRFTSEPVVDAFEAENYRYEVTTSAVAEAPKISAPVEPDWLTLTDNGDGSAVLAGIPTSAHVGEHQVELGLIAGASSDSQVFSLTVSAAVWPQQFGSSAGDSATSLAVDSAGNLFVAGGTYGSLGASNNAGLRDSFLAKFAPRGRQLWIRQIGSPEFDSTVDVAAIPAGGSYVLGQTSGALPGHGNAGGTDVFLLKYDTSGTLEWSREFGTSAYDYAGGVAVDGSGNAYLTGSTDGVFFGQSNAGITDVFLIKYDPNGTQLWTRQFGSTAGDIGTGISLDEFGNIFVGGYTLGTLPTQTSAGERDLFLTKFLPSGSQVWARQFGGAGDDYGQAVATESSGNVFISGFTDGALPGHTNSGDYDLLLVKYNPDGNRIWTRQHGSNDFDSGWGLSVDAAGNAFVTGSTAGALPGQTNQGDLDAVLLAYAPDGELLLASQFGTSQQDEGAGVAVAATGSAYIAGETAGAFQDAASSGNYDVFVYRFVSTIRP